MDPKPSMTVSSEAWSAASSSIIDTRSEPPRCRGKEAERMTKKRLQSPGPVAVARGSDQSLSQPPSALEAKLSSGRMNVNSASLQSSSYSKPRKKADSSSSSPQASETNTASASASARSRKSNKSHSSSSLRGKTTVTSFKLLSTKSKGSQASLGSNISQNHSHSTDRKRSSSSSSTGRIATSSLHRHQHPRDPEQSTTSNHRESSRPNLAIVPVSSSRPQSNIDPPSGASTSGESSSTECASTLYDPPSGDVPYARVYQPTVPVWKEGIEEEEEESETQESSVPRDTTTSASSALGGSSSSRSTRSSESYYSDCSNEESETTSRGGNGTSIVSAAERALTIRGKEKVRDDKLAILEESQPECLSTQDEEEDEDDTHAKDARALVQSEYHGGVNSCYEEGKEGGGNMDGRSGQLVPTEGRFLSSAVDNHHAIVPIDSAIYEAYDHTFVTCPENLRFRFLFTFLKKNLDKKIMIFFSTMNSAKYHARLLEHFHVPVTVMHGQQRREKFINRFFKFSDLDEGILCATDAAGRDLDVPPSVDWVVQFEPPDDPSEYILRVARISCDSDRVGRSLLFLNPGEHGFLKYYHSASIPVSEFEIPDKLADIQSNIEYHVNESERLLRYARDAYGSYLIAYASHGFRDVYNVHDLNKVDVAAAFGLVGLPNSTDDQTADTTTLGDYGCPVFVGAGGDLGGSGPGLREGGDSSGGARRTTWEKKEKPKTRSWMRGEKSWPHCQIKMHPKFTKGTAVSEHESGK